MNYEELVNKRKNFIVEYPGFFNQSSINKFDDGNCLDPWGRWHKKIPASILLIGQDWGDKKYFISNKGMDNYNNPTCFNLIKLFDKAGINIGKPNAPNRELDIHFANVIPFLRMENMQGDKFITPAIISDSVNEFLKPLIQIVSPKVIITLGKIPLMAVMLAYGQTGFKSKSLKKIIEGGPIKIDGRISVFPMFHCGALGVNINRRMPEQEKDWAKLKDVFGSL